MELGLGWMGGMEIVCLGSGQFTRGHGKIDDRYQSPASHDESRRRISEESSYPNIHSTNISKDEGGHTKREKQRRGYSGTMCLKSKMQTSHFNFIGVNDNFCLRNRWTCRSGGRQWIRWGVGWEMIIMQSSKRRRTKKKEDEIRVIKTNDTYEIVQTGKQRKLFIRLLTWLAR